MVVMSQPFDMVSTQMSVNGIQLSFKVRKKALTISSVFLICVLAVFTMFSVVQVFTFFFLIAEMQRHLYLLNCTIPSHSAAPPSVTFCLDIALSP